MTVTVNHAKTNAISDWTQAQLDEQIALGNFAPGTTLANIVLPSDWNDDHTLTGLGTMAEQNANTVAITGGSVNGTTIGATTASTGRFTSVTTPSVTATTTNLNFYPVSTGNVIVNQSSGGAYGLVLAQDTSTLQNSARLFFDSNVNVASIRNNAGGGLAISTGATIGSTSGAIQFQVSPTASAVNYVQVTGGATGNSPVISGQGSDSNVALSFTSKGTNAIRFLSNNAANLQFRIVGTNTAVNNLAVTGTIATNAPSLSSEGSDTNISMAFQPKGTGAIDLAAGSSGVNISNGGTVTAITRTVQGSGYTSVPSLAISAPTTAGGVQATATANLGVLSATIVSGGTGYAVGNTLTVVGGTGTAAQLTVSTVSSGVITAVTIAAQNGVYSVFPTSPVSVTGGAGSGATFNISGGILSTFTITAAGSGYIEQPTITFSGGGGSGAAAYATVGSGTIVKALGNNINFNTPNSQVLSIVDKNSGGNYPTNTNPAFTMVPSQNAFGASYLGMLTSGYFATNNTSASAYVFATGITPPLNGNGGSAQLQIGHTASAVNYVQVTGSATGANPVISSQGSDTNIGLRSYSKGAVGLSFWTNGGASRQFQVEHTAGTIVNYATATGSATGVAPAFSVAGSDTNIDLALTPKGTGLVRFGTYVAGALLATGYINIKAADGTTYKVLVST